MKTMDIIDVTICQTKLKVANDLLQEVLHTIGETDISREDFTELSRDVVQAISHLRKAVEDKT